MKQARLLSKKPIPGGPEFLIMNGQATIGKDTSNTISLPYKAVSRRHVSIFYDEAEKCYFLEDLKSHNGTLLDGERVRRKERLDSIHVITISNKFDIFFQMLHEKNKGGDQSQTEEMAEDKKVTVVREDKAKKREETPAKASQHETLTRLPSAPSNEDDFFDRNRKKAVEQPRREKKASFDDIIAYPGEATVTIEKTRLHIDAIAGSGFIFQVEGSGRKFRLRAGENIVGRSKECTISLPDKTVSNRHACFVVEHDEIRLRDLESKNHTYVRDNLVKHWTRIKPNSRVRFGKVVGVLKVQKGAPVPA